MKKIITLLSCLCYVILAFSQTTIPAEYQKMIDQVLPAEALVTTTPFKVLDSSIFLRIDQTNELSLEDQNIFLYDTLAREIREFSSNYDINEDTLLFIGQSNTTYAPNKVIRSNGSITQSQYVNINRNTNTFREEEVLLNRLEENWDETTNSFVPFRLFNYFFIENTNLADSILTETWNATDQEWELASLSLQFFGGDDLRDSVYSYRRDNNTNQWKLDNKLTSQYDALGQLTQLNIYQWDTNLSAFVLQININEYYNGDELKDSAHVYSYFGGFYNETYTVFTQQNNQTIADTIYSWNAVDGLVLSNYQTYQYDLEGDLTVQKTYAYDPISSQYTLITQADYFYSTIDVNTAIQNTIPSSAKCTFANPYSPGQLIRCEWTEPNSEGKARLYNLEGKLYLEKDISGEKQVDFSLKTDIPPGLYILSLENSAGQIGHYKLVIP